tara:strand:+ start:226 stop:549 length:324 start_codon:yes stop_codon:yes gene_type:complete
MADVVRKLGGTLREIRIERVVDYTFYAVLYITQADEVRQIDCRPTDAMCLAARLQAPIYVAGDLLNKVEHRSGGTITLSRGEEAVHIDGTNIDVLAARILEQAGGPL